MTETYEVAKKIPELVTTEVPYQVAVTEYIEEAFEVEELEAYTVDVEVPYTVEA